MSTPYDGKILLVQVKGSYLLGKTINEVASTIRQRMPNVAGVFLETNQGHRWQDVFEGYTASGTWYPHNDPKGITGPERIEEWADVCSQHGLEVHVWGIPRGLRVADEAQTFVEAAQVPGVKSLALDVEHGEYYWEGRPADARTLMQTIRTAVGEEFHIAMILDGRKNRDWGEYVDPFTPYVDSLHPMVYPILFGRTIAGALTEAFTNLKPLNKPIVPMLQSYEDVGGRPTPEQITQQGRTAFVRGAAGITFFCLGDRHMGDPEYTGVAAIQPIQPPVIEVHVTYTFQDVINAFAVVAADYNADYGEWLGNTGLIPILPSGAGRYEVYSGPRVLDLPGLTEEQKTAIADLVNEKSSEELREAAREALRRVQPPRPPQRTPTGAIIGIHGAPGHVAPPLDTWDSWIRYLKDMGVRWYKQCDDGHADEGLGSIFRWVLRLRDEGITPVVRYLQASQFPNRLEERFFHKMRRYAAEGVLWAEIGNEPNLTDEWVSEWQTRIDHNDSEVIRVIAETWLQDAEAALMTGVRPALYAFALTDWRLPDEAVPPPWSSVVFTYKVCEYLAQHHRDRTRQVFQHGGWVAVHSATYEQPVDFHPFTQGKNIWDMCLRGYEVPLDALEKHLDLNRADVVVMSTEGGVFTPKSTSMAGHTPLQNEEEHAQWVIEMFEWLEKYSSMQAMMPWCLSVGSKIGHYHEKFRHDGWIQQVGAGLRPRPVIARLRELRESRPPA